MENLRWGGKGQPTTSTDRTRATQLIDLPASPVTARLMPPLAVSAEKAMRQAAALLSLKVGRMAVAVPGLMATVAAALAPRLNRISRVQQALSPALPGLLLVCRATTMTRAQ